MLRIILIVGLGLSISMTLGALVGIVICSQQNWCPRYLRRQLDAWRKQMAKQYAERQARRVAKVNGPTPPEKDHAA